MTTLDSWHEYFMGIARSVSTRATCPRKSVGCVIVKDKRIVATGYNGSLPKEPHCTDVGCAIYSGHCVRTVHAETNALLQAAKEGITLNNTTLYCTAQPCWNCFKNLITAGITSIYYSDSYDSETNKLVKDYLDSNPNLTFTKIILEE